MKSFSFRLQTLLTVRELYEEEAERRFSEALRDFTLAVEKLDGLKNDLAGSYGELAAERERRMDLNIQMLYENYIRSLREQIDRQIKVVEESEAAMEERRAELLERMKDRKTIERLRVRDLDRYLQDLRRFEQSIIDDLATLRSDNFDLEKFRGAAI